MTPETTRAFCRGRPSPAKTHHPLPHIPNVTQAVKQQQQQHLGSTWQAAAAARQQRALQVQLPRALKDEEAEIDRMTKEAAQTDIWGNEVVGNAVKVRTVHVNGSLVL